MVLHPIEAGNFKLDGGGMFGVVPKTIWQRTNPADANNLIDIAARCLLVEDGDKLTLIDTGMGYKQSDQFFGYYSPWGSYNLKDSVKKAGFSMDEVTDVFLSHLHFDHVGGAVQWNKDRSAYEMAFKNAHFWTNKRHWDWATKPNAREKASFLKENLLPIEAAGQLRFLRDNTQVVERASDFNFEVFYADGHTEKQMLPMIQYQGKTLVFMGDLLPTTGHIPLPYVMGYDTRPLLTLKEKAYFLDLAATHGYYLFLEHDAHHEVITVKHTEKGVRLDQVFAFSELFN
ncbi:MAG: MBL fold metallo-hydrolase [Flavobacteriaceae bacterium]|jgi:glyoxylase-like metal-dependent hydrolase (beta-lactamase superfamily II)|nr:MBL fold metallo-hydrolase [Flavobacteriaceae bacterium]MDG1759932.1 MBL fold metallo-hydrolase [Flavobacteriaceae bacterium]MDG2318467.1 MBL fold metallo-hydrolase [Flavobacteriaceae bacterium]